ncbi:MAG TPA: adenosylmethionine decarboxylase [Clostridia bacterium]|nr:adenosylmethionine decarboxylase [Clostridia bacterium]
MDTMGKHILLDCWGVPQEIIKDNSRIKQILCRCVELSGASLLQTAEHVFQPQGYSLLLLISESHFSIHTFPEAGYCSLDFYTYGKRDCEKAMNYLLGELKPADYKYSVIERGKRGEIK